METRKIISASIILLLVLSVLTASTTVRGQEEQGEKQKLLSLISRIREWLGRIKEASTRLNDTEKARQVVELANRGLGLLDEAENLVGQNDLEGAKQKIREVFKLLKEIAELLGKEKSLQRIGRRLWAYIRFVKALRSHIAKLERVLDRLERAGEDVSQARSLLEEAKNYLQSSIEAARARNATEARHYLQLARQKLGEAWNVTRSLIREYFAQKAPTIYERFKDLLDRIYERLMNVSPVLAERFREWAEKREQVIEGLLNDGRYLEAIREIRKSLGQLKRFLEVLRSHGKALRIIGMAERIANRIKDCNATLSGLILEKVGQIKEAIRARDWHRTAQLIRELIPLLREARACLGTGKQ